MGSDGPFQPSVPRTRFMGPIRCSHMDPNYRDLCNSGYDIRVYCNERERPNWTMADPNAGLVETANAVTYRGTVEIRLTRTKQEKAK